MPRRSHRPDAAPPGSRSTPGCRSASAPRRPRPRSAAGPGTRCPRAGHLGQHQRVGRGTPARRRTSSWHHAVPAAFTRTATARSPSVNSGIRAASSTRARAFSCTATESSRSTTISSAESPTALPTFARSDAGTDRHERRTTTSGDIVTSGSRRRAPQAARRGRECKAMATPYPTTRTGRHAIGIPTLPIWPYKSDGGVTGDHPRAGMVPGPADARAEAVVLPAHAGWSLTRIAFGSIHSVLPAHAGMVAVPSNRRFNDCSAP